MTASDFNYLVSVVWLVGAMSANDSQVASIACFAGVAHLVGALLYRWKGGA